MRAILLIATVIVLFALAGGVSAHDDRLDEMMDQCMEMMGQMGEMMGNGMMSESDSAHESDPGDDTYIHNGEEHDRQSDQGEMGCC